MNCNKRLLKEVTNLIKQQNSKKLLDNDYLISLDEQDIFKVHAIIKGPYDSVYRHKFIRLTLTFTDNYPYEPPVVTFVNYSEKRIHPILYECGRVCLTILNTWPSENERWSSSMTIETILLVIMSFLDWHPYKHEPGGRDDETFTDYVKYQSWYTCLINYIDKETIFKNYIDNYIIKNWSSIYMELYNLNYEYPHDYYETVCFEIDLYIINYQNIINTLQVYQVQPVLESCIESCIDTDVNYNHNYNYKCEICFDTLLTGVSDIKNTTLVTLECGHSFHKDCVSNHMIFNNNCSLCRAPIKIEYVMNPETNRKIKVGGKVYKYLIDIGYDLP
jgi:ubiquitin-protein ligase